MTELNWAILGLGASVLFVYALTMWRTWCWKRTNKKPLLKGLALPEGSIRGLLAFLIVGAFIILLLFGKGPLSTEKIVIDKAANTTITTTDTALYTTVVSSLGTLTAVVVGFYFGARITQQTQGAGDRQDDADNDTPGGRGTGN